jgi:hypothetical protein
MNKKAIVESMLKNIKNLLMMIDDDQVYRAYPAIYDKLEKEGLINIVVPEKEFKRPVYPWEIDIKQGVNVEEC